MGKYSTSHQKSSNLTALHHLDREFMCMGMIWSWGVQKRGLVPHV